MKVNIVLLARGRRCHHTTKWLISEEKEIKKKDRKMRGGRIYVTGSGRCKSWPPLGGLTILMWTPPRPLLNCAKLIWRSMHIFYANATVLSTQGACREAGRGVNGAWCTVGGRDENGMGWVRQGDGGYWRCIKPQQHPAGTSTPCSSAVTLFFVLSAVCILRWKE